MSSPNPQTAEKKSKNGQRRQKAEFNLKSSKINNSDELTQTPAKLGKISKTFPKMDEKGMLKSFVCEVAKLKPKVAERSEKKLKSSQKTP